MCWKDDLNPMALLLEFLLGQRNNHFHLIGNKPPRKMNVAQVKLSSSLKNS
jgi:hypothetical protein